MNYADNLPDAAACLGLFAVAAGIHTGARVEVPDSGWCVEWFDSRENALTRLGEFRRGRSFSVPRDHPTRLAGHDALVVCATAVSPSGRVMRSVSQRQRGLRIRDAAATRRASASATPHDRLVVVAGKWLRLTMRCSVVIAEMSSAADERPDAIGWANGWSVLAECKTSRADFLADSAKPFRAFPESGMGRFRWYFAPPGVIAVNELPPMWGLAEYDGKCVHRAAEAVARDQWNRDAEIRHIVSALRRKGGDE